MRQMKCRRVVSLETPSIRIVTEDENVLLSSLIRGLPASCITELRAQTVRGGESAEHEAGSAIEPQILGMSEDSRTVQPGWLFIARGGTKSDGKQFIESAIASGAVAIVTDDARAAASIAGRVAVVMVSDIALATALLAETFHADPAKKLHAVGVTGTNGKTTISWLVYQLLRAMHVQGNSISCGLVGTVAIDEGDGLRTASMTTPPAIEMSRMFAAMREQGCAAVSMEVSSHALHQKRADALRFAAAIFTNLTGDHLDYHGTMEQYADAKARLFELLAPDGVAIVNVGGDGHERMLRACTERGVRVMRVRAIEALGEAAHETNLAAVQQAAGGFDAAIIVHAQSLAGIDATIFSPFGAPARVRVPLVGTYNAINVLQALLAAHVAATKCGIVGGLAWQKLLAQVPSISAPPGRLERVSAMQAPYGVFVDYAHSDDSLRNVLTAVRACMTSSSPSSATVPSEQSPSPRLHCVFGCGGDRDRTKRPRMGLAAAELADRVVITSDNPRTEDPDSIVAEVFAGVPASLADKVHQDAQRARAIAFAVGQARAGDVIVIAGKGHETYQLLPDGKGGILRTDFDDRAVARAALQDRGLPTFATNVTLRTTEIEAKPTAAAKVGAP